MTFLGSFLALLLALGAGALSLATWPLRFALRSLRRRASLTRLARSGSGAGWEFAA